MDEVILVRCDDCAQAACVVECGCEAIVVAAGDVLIDTAKCLACNKRGTAGVASSGAASCVAQCDKSAKKSLRTSSLREKRVAAAESIH